VLREPAGLLGPLGWLGIESSDICGTSTLLNLLVYFIRMQVDSLDKIAMHILFCHAKDSRSALNACRFNIGDQGTQCSLGMIYFHSEYEIHGTSYSPFDDLPCVFFQFIL